jgi:YD repeat-containing protein
MIRGPVVVRPVLLGGSDFAAPPSNATAPDNSGRTIGYAYDSAGTLATVIYPDTTTEQYTYDASHHMLTMQDRRGHVWVTNQYDTNGRVIKQTYADNTSYQFAYTTDSSNTVTATTVTNPNGNQEQVAFDPASGYPSSDTQAYGTSLAQTTTFNREPSGLADSVCPALQGASWFATTAWTTGIHRTAGGASLCLGKHRVWIPEPILFHGPDRYCHASSCSLWRSFQSRRMVAYDSCSHLVVYDGLRFNCLFGRGGYSRRAPLAERIHTALFRSQYIRRYGAGRHDWPDDYALSA